MRIEAKSKKNGKFIEYFHLFNSRWINIDFWKALSKHFLVEIT